MACLALVDARYAPQGRLARAGACRARLRAPSILVPIPVPVRACAPAPVMPLQPSDIERIATLARLRLDAAEQAAMLEQINAFFTEVVEPMRAVDTSGVQPLAHPLAVLREMPLRLREDAPREPQLREAALRNAPAAQDGLFIVPRVVE